MRPQFPATSSPVWAVGAMVVLMIVFHLAFVWWWRLSSRGWKVTDYVWLSFAALGVLSAASDVRRIVAASQLDTFRHLVTVELSTLEEYVTLNTSGHSVCRLFIRSEFSPPSPKFEQTQKEYDDACDWFKDTGRRLANQANREPIILRDADFAPMPTVSDAVLAEIFSAFWEYRDRYNQRVANFLELAAKSDRSNAELTMALLSPFLIAVSLALRFTKVTGELLLERRRDSKIP